MKKIISLIMCTVILVTAVTAVFPAFALVQETDIEKTQILSSNTYYSYSAETKTLTISGSGAVPDFTNSSGASNSQPWALWRSDGSVEHVVIEEGITSLGAYCLYNVSKADISLPSTLITLGSYSMAGTSGNTDVALPSSVKTISANAFYYTTGLKSIYIPASVTTIGRSAFENCTALAKVKFASSNMQVTIERRAFFKCASLKSVTVPKRASLADYSIGYYSASSGSVYSDFVMKVYRDSAAYTYAVNKIVPYELIGSMEIFEGDTIERTYYDDSISSVMTFVFTPKSAAKYTLFSSGEIDVKCEMTDTAGNVLTTADDVSTFDSNFSLTEEMQAGQTYYFNVSSNNNTGDFSISLIPFTVAQIDVDSDIISISADERENGYFDVESHIDGRNITLTFDTGYTAQSVYSNGVTILGKEITYSDSQQSAKWLCGSHSCSLSVGDVSASIPVEINHSYAKTVVEPTYKEKGYTVYTCSLCKDTFYSDYVNSIGVKVTGRVVLMQDTDGSHKDNIPVAMTKILVASNEVCTVENDGTFLIYVDAGTESITLSETYGLTKTVPLNTDSENVADLGDIPFFHFDYNGDGYVNAKDFAIIKRVYGVYPKIEKDRYLSRDYNQDGAIDSSDWFDVGAQNFYTIGKITEEIY
ncbi:MAG: leucine-rich repeat protein [Eubacteriales bacterium]|nr:leucine-rich repeat protein [Eubacteriales bacterium]